MDQPVGGAAAHRVEAELGSVQHLPDDSGNERALRLGHPHLAFLDTGAFPEPVLANLARTYAHTNVEFHVHLLANDIGKRRHVLSDLRGEA